jgi:lipoprotein-releasing system ATP-binding protein
MTGAQIPPAVAESAVPAHPPVLEAVGVEKSYRGGDGARIQVLAGVDLTVSRGEMVAVVGASGAGKSTFLHVLGALDRPDAGEVRLGGLATRSASDEALAELRNRTVGFVFQFHHLLKEFSALENVMMPLRIAAMPIDEARARAEALLVRVGLGARMQHRPAELSGGEQQRAAVARALAARPPLLLADEPSGNLDHQNAERLHDLFAELTAEMSVGVVVVTHNRSLAARASRVLHLEDGRLAPALASAGGASDDLRAVQGARGAGAPHADRGERGDARASLRALRGGARDRDGGAGAEAPARGFPARGPAAGGADARGCGAVRLLRHVAARLPRERAAGLRALLRRVRAEPARAAAAGAWLDAASGLAVCPAAIRRS